MRLTVPVIIFFLFFGTAACQPQISGSSIQVKQAWGRPSPASASVGAIYMQVENKGKLDDRLVSASSPACSLIEIHETIHEGDTMAMRPVAGGTVALPAGEVVEFKTGGMHLMCIDKLEEFNPGTTIQVFLLFETAGELSLDVEIRNP